AHTALDGRRTRCACSRITAGSTTRSTVTIAPRFAASAPYTFSMSGGVSTTFPAASAAGAWKIDTSGTRADTIPSPGSHSRYACRFSRAIDEPASDRVVVHGRPRAAAARRCTYVRIDQCSNSTPACHARWYTGDGPGVKYESPAQLVTSFFASPAWTSTDGGVESWTPSNVNPGPCPWNCRTSSHSATPPRVCVSPRCTASPGRTNRSTASRSGIVLSSVGSGMRKVRARSSERSGSIRRRRLPAAMSQQNDRKAVGTQGAKTRSRLLDAARSAFADRGYPATRVDDITQTAGTSHGAFYLYFANK